MGRRLRFACLGVALLLTSEAAALESSGFTLETGSPDALCPDLEATREIVARRLGSLVVEGRKGWLARYTIGHAPAGNPRDFVRLELFNPEGALELRRDLPMEGDSCRTMSEVIALVLDRHFRGLAASETAEATKTTEATEATDGPKAREASKASEATEDAKSAPKEGLRATVTRAPDGPRLAFSRPTPAEPTPPGTSQPSLAGPGPRLSAEYAASFAQPDLGLRFCVGLGPQPKLEAMLGVRWGVASAEESDPRGARVTARTVTSRAGAAFRLALPAGVLHVGPVLSLALQRATTRGLEVQTDRTRALWMAGIEAGFVVPVARHLFIEGSSSLDFSVPGAAGQFLIDNREVLAPRAVTLGGSLGFGYVWGK